METPIDSKCGEEAFKNRKFFIAYTLNNEQPVRCTIIHDQPLFYMDYEGDMDIEDEGEFFDFTEAGELRPEKISGAQPFALEDDARFENFSKKLREAVAPVDSEKAKEPPSIVALEDILRHSRMATALLDFAAQFDTGFEYNRHINGAVYDRVAATIQLHPEYDEADRILLAVRELRRVWQHRNGVLINPVTFHPDQAIVINRAQIADLAVMMIRVAWELQLAGIKEPWDRLESSSMEDLTRAFARESCMDFRSLNNGMAASAVFESWFLSDRCRYEDRCLIQLMLSDYQGHVFENTESARTVTAEMIVTLGSMPFGKNYLAPHVATIIGYPLFTEVRDRSNANFLWFIKFERSFREAEHELQQGDDKARSVRYETLKNDKKDWFGDNEKTSHVITLPSAAGKRSENDPPFSDTGADIISFQHKET